MSLKMNEMDYTTHSNIPYSVVLFQLLEQWKVSYYFIILLSIYNNIVIFVHETYYNLYLITLSTTIYFNIKKISNHMIIKYQ